MKFMTMTAVAWMLSTVCSPAATQEFGVGRADSAGRNLAYSLPHTEVISIESSQEREIEQVLYVSLPRDYEAEERTYPVVFVLDPDCAFAIAHNVVEHFVDRGNLPPMIVVGVGYHGQSQDIGVYRRHRTRDSTPTHALSGWLRSRDPETLRRRWLFRDD